MKKILLIGLGGTIACGSSKQGLVPKYSLLDLLKQQSKITEKAKISTVQLLKRTIVYPKDWIVLAKFIVKKLNKFDGFVVAMGTDTLAYTSAMLSFMLQGIDKPIVFTGAMIPMQKMKSDARKNLRDSFLFVCSGYPGVFVVFGGMVILGSRASKSQTNSIFAFESINYPCFAKIKNNKIIFKGKGVKKENKLLVDTKINTNVIVVKLGPQLDKNIFQFMSSYDGIIIEGYGDGNISDNLTPELVKIIKKKSIIVSSQCPYGKVEHKYKGGLLAIKSGAISSKDMTKEAILTKLMWCLAKTREPKEVKKLMHYNMCEEITEKV